MMTPERAKILYKYFSNVRGLGAVCIGGWHQIVIEVHAGNVLLFRIPHNEKYNPA